MAVGKRAVGKKAAPAGLVAAIYEGLCREIITGRLRPGELLSRRRIARRYGSSYTPVIEAMVRLEEAGLVEAESAQMARVRPMTLENIRGVYVLLEAYETQAIRLGCAAATNAEIDDLAAAAVAVDERIARRNGRDREGVALHWQFHTLHRPAQPPSRLLFRTLVFDGPEGRIWAASAFYAGRQG